MYEKRKMSLKTNQTMNIIIPTEYEEKVRIFLNTLRIEESEESEEESKAEMSPLCIKKKKSFVEAKKILDHQVDEEGWWFLIKFSDGSKLWIKDEGTNCEWLISHYLENLDIDTIYIICRVSSKGQVGEDHVSLDAQESELRIVASTMFPDKKRIKVKKFFASAYKKLPREIVQVGDACKGEDVIMVYRIDRLTRYVDCLPWLYQLNDCGVKIYSHSEQICFDTHKNDFIQGVLNAEKESILLGERIKMSIRRRRERGDEVFGRTSFGKRSRKTETGKIVLEDNYEELTLIKRIKYNMKGSDSFIANNLNNRKILKRGKMWNSGMISRIKQL
jgi:DNA invertase Pin-like site-specific DNA recombinase